MYAFQMEIPDGAQQSEDTISDIVVDNMLLEDDEIHKIIVSA